MGGSLSRRLARASVAVDVPVADSDHIYCARKISLRDEARKTIVVMIISTAKNPVWLRRSPAGQKAIPLTMILAVPGQSLETPNPRVAVS